MIRRPKLNSVISLIKTIDYSPVFISLFTDGSYTISKSPASPVYVELQNPYGESTRKKVRKALDKLEGVYDHNRRETNTRVRDSSILDSEVD